MGIKCTCDNCGKEGHLEISFALGAWEGPQDWLYVGAAIDPHTYKKTGEPPQLVCSEQCRLQLQEKGVTPCTNT